MSHQPRYDRDGVPLDGRDWTVADWQDLWEAMQAARRRIADRHKHRRAQTGAPDDPKPPGS